MLGPAFDQLLLQGFRAPVPAARAFGAFSLRFCQPAPLHLVGCENDKGQLGPILTPRKARKAADKVQRPGFGVHLDGMGFVHAALGIPQRDFL